MNIGATWQIWPNDCAWRVCRGDDAACFEINLGSFVVNNDRITVSFG